MFVDLHIHSALSPCAENDMTPNNIVNMALIKGLSVIAVCDHNCARNQRAIAQVASSLDIEVIFGIEVCSVEEVHICTYFKDLTSVENMGKWVEGQWMNIPNNVTYFGHQLVMNEFDEVVEEVATSLSFAITASIEEIVAYTHLLGGRCVYAHAINKSHGVIRQLGMFPSNVEIDGIETRTYEEGRQLKEQYPSLGSKLWTRSSDAHQLSDIYEEDYWMDEVRWKEFWGDKT